MPLTPADDALCEFPAVAKKRGDSNQSFAHHVQVDAEHGPESVDPLVVKFAVDQRVDSTPGWCVIAEFPHPSWEWIVAVLAKSVDGRRRIVFEVQRSFQTPDW